MCVLRDARSSRAPQHEALHPSHSWLRRLRRQRECGDRPDQRVEAVGRTAVEQTFRPEGAHLVLERGERADMMRALLLVELRDPGAARKYLPRVARTDLTGKLADTSSNSVSRPLPVTLV